MRSWEDEEQQESDTHPPHDTSQTQRRIHILGVGNVGTFIAHSLAGVPNRPPITLLLKRWQKAKILEEMDGGLKVTTEGMTEIRKGFDVETTPYEKQSFRKDESSRASRLEKAPLLQSRPQEHMPTTIEPKTQEIGHGEALTTRQEGFTDPAEREIDNRCDIVFSSNTERLSSESLEESSEHLDTSSAGEGGFRSGQGSPRVQGSRIHSLIVTTKAYATAKALKPHAHRLTADSTIMFLQNGMGVIDEVNEICFPNPETRPQYIIGVNSHGLHTRNAFDVVHAGTGTIALGILPGTGSAKPLIDAPSSSRYLLSTMVRVPAFVAVGFAPNDLLQQQLDKLAINAIINPITALLDIKNGNINENFFLKRVIRLLLAEISLVIRSLPELQNVVNVNMRFDSLRLERLVFRIAQLTANNTSSMLQDVRAQGQTEIDYINGYIVKRGEQLGIHCVMNYMLMQLVKAQGELINKEKEGLLPFGLLVR